VRIVLYYLWIEIEVSTSSFYLYFSALCELGYLSLIFLIFFRELLKLNEELERSELDKKKYKIMFRRVLLPYMHQWRVVVISRLEFRWHQRGAREAPPPSVENHNVMLDNPPQLVGAATRVDIFCSKKFLEKWRDRTELRFRPPNLIIMKWRRLNRPNFHDVNWLF